MAWSLTHKQSYKQSYKDIFAITMIKTAAVFFIIGVCYATGVV